MAKASGVYCTPLRPFKASSNTFFASGVMVKLKSPHPPGTTLVFDITISFSLVFAALARPARWPMTCRVRRDVYGRTKGCARQQPGRRIGRHLSGLAYARNGEAVDVAATGLLSTVFYGIF